MISHRLRLAVAALALATAHPVAAQAQEPSFRVMSYNIRYDNPEDRPDWRARRGPMARQIASISPDILGVQEALLPMVADLSAGLPDYAHYGVGRDDGDKAGETTTIFYRDARFERLLAETRWCSPTPERPGKAYDAALPRTYTRVVLRDRASGVLLDVRNAHLDHKGAESRRLCARQIRDQAAWPNARLVVLGDFNSLPTDPPHAALTSGENGLRDARAASAVVSGPAGTFNDFSPSAPPTGPIDYVFVDRGFRTARFATLTDTHDGQVISDHFPVVAEIVLRPLN
ncbi:endonuclease/exonuclease/phosphatase family protein [Caulobacter sp. RL271]|uniref:Endonuclease/exonuclease/phosphatase family protein n=2 Tax=Caulobacter TaxID=75 RepID=A0ABY4ZYZ2_9CAUL|nr:endonuclease/exonuclease/phosphatase family protein [Caulobacter segnis]USQ97212.1 endonuclease/exonuclease/phosphatase family protein [Caulobacter segnis]